MTRRVVPMIHVPDVRKTLEWYESIGFSVVNTGAEEEGGEIIWAMLRFGDGTIMLSAGGQPSTQRRREVDLYVYVDDVEDLYKALKDRLEVVEPLYDAFYGMREFIVRDVNRFWITFGQEIRGGNRTGSPARSQSSDRSRP